MERRTFLKTAALGLILSTPAFSDEIKPEQKIVVNVPSYELTLYENNEPISKYRCRVGKKSAPTPIGSGNILLKRDQIVFRYLSGDRKGQVIRYSYLNPEDRTIKMPYDKMRGLDFDTNGIMSGPVIHSTTDYWTVGTAVSHGCVGLEIDNMLELYEKVKDNPLPKMITTYETMFFDEDSGKVTIWCDVYGKKSNNSSHLFEILGNSGIETKHYNPEKLQDRLKEIDNSLNEGNKEVQKVLSKGKNPENILEKLHYELGLEEILE